MRSFTSRQSRLASIGVALVVAAAVAGVAIAATPSQKLITACVQGHGGTLRIVSPGRRGHAGSCGPTESKLIWNQRGLPGADGDRGATGSPGANGINGSTGATGQPGSQGATGPAGPITGTLPSGVTEKGVFVARGDHTTDAYSGTVDTAISFPLSLSGTASLYYVYPSGPTTPCTGTLAAPTAPPGDVCIYQGVTSQVDLVEVIDPVTTVGAVVSGSGSSQPASAEPLGVILRAYGDGSGPFYIYGTWAVTAR